MTPLLILRDVDIFANPMPTEGVSFVDRKTVKVILQDSEGKIALVGTKYRLLPGGGVDGDESFETAVRRECLEEVGCDVEVGELIGLTEEFRIQNTRHQFTYCFTARVIGEKGAPTTTQDDERGMQVEWFTPEDALAKVVSQIPEIPPERYNSCFNARTHKVFLEQFLKR